MATQQTAHITVLNKTGGNAKITIFHKNSTNGIQCTVFDLDADAVSSRSMKVYFETGIDVAGTEDYWSAMALVTTGSNPGWYINSSSRKAAEGGAFGKECQLESADAGKTMQFVVSTTNFNIALKSGCCSDSMMKLAPYIAGNPAISHVFVVMLENRSFDNIFGQSGIANIAAATTSNYNTYSHNDTNTTYSVVSGAPASMTNARI